MNDYKAGIGVSAGRYMIKWDAITQELNSNKFEIQPGENINVFINFESIMKNMALHKYIVSDLRDHKQAMVIEMESSILNLMAHYRGYFKKRNAMPKLYFYYTDLLSESPQEMEVYNKYYRTFYKNRYLQDPKFRDMGRVLTDIIIPETELILTYVPDCYFIKSKTFDSSLIPLIISEQSDARNILVTGDVFDTLYLFNPNFLTLYAKNRFQYYSLQSTIEGTVQSIVKDMSPFDLTIYNSELYYRLLLSVKGSKIRNIKAAKRFGYGTLTKLLKGGIEKGFVLQDFSSLDSIIELFNENVRDELRQAFMCTSINTQRDLITESDISGIKDQLIDKIDLTSLEILNNKRFFDAPINLTSLVY